MRDNHEAFKETLAAHILVKSFGQVDADDSLDDFSTYLATEAWEILPPKARSASYEEPFAFDDLKDDVFDATPLQFSDTLVAYGIVDDRDDALKLLRNAIDTYLQEACAAPPVGKQTRLAECEICEREIPLTYHHLIPRSVHNKVLKRGWHPQERLNAVAWLCRYCHSTVHRLASNEDLARYFYTVDLLLAREDIQRWRAWAGRQRYGKRRG
ncbi:hypothetical protein EXIGLDRAFT_639669 [Exidia glandulosa HHB12029]|uniref:HNH domain-containing protein n=1 Tax=Exidia glandulosa HHB12029 TaxID=1314781 RepID=A0A165N616_EXIGL|nr:hypothetical protein EXIGLDRAFT_639669 [Exidia glandulosa HHB12029]